MSLFDMTPNPVAECEVFEDSTIYWIDNFYAHPEEIIQHIDEALPAARKHNFENVPKNMIHFEDLPHLQIHDGMVPVIEFLSKHTNLKPVRALNEYYVNFNMFKKGPFNDYKNHYWYPHQDVGYNCVVYLNVDDNECGTNLYLNLDPKNEPPKHPLYTQPWRPKSRFKLLKTIKSQFNRLVIFDGSKFVHGMNICNDRYFGEEYRRNQVVFFTEKNAEI